MFLLKRLSDVCGWLATTYASLYYHGNWGGLGGGVCKWRAVRREKPARCVIAAKQQQQQTALPVCWQELPYLLLYQYREATESISSQIHQVIVKDDKDGWLILLFVLLFALR